MEFFPDIYGADRGFNVYADTLTADGIDYNVLWNEFQEELADWNRGRDAFQALFSFNTTDAFGLLADDISNKVRFEVSSEFGVPKAARAEVDYLRMGYSFEWYDLGARFTRRFLRNASAEQVRAVHAAAFEADNRLIFGDIMRALTSKPASIETRPRDDGQGGTGLPIYSLWDGLSDSKPPAFGGQTFAAGHQHYLVSGAATIDSGDVEVLIDTIQEHGYGVRSSGEQIVIFAHPSQAVMIKTWRANTVNANGATALYDFIPAQGTPAYLSAEDIVGDKPPATFNKLSIDGSYGDAYIHGDYLVPQGYVIAVATAGPNRDRNPVAFRQDPRPGLQGLLLIPEAETYPLIESYYQRGFGTGVRHRSAAAVMQIKASGTYDNPEWPS